MFEKKLEEFYNEMIISIDKKISECGGKILIDDENFVLNIKGNMYLSCMSVTTGLIKDNQGYSYSLDTLDIRQLALLADHVKGLY